jgi:hypothetical protein
LILTAAVLFSADDPWKKVRELKSGTEMRIYKTSAKQPITANMDELKDESLVVVVKNEQVAISRDEIDRIDARPPQTGSRVTKETKATINTHESQPATPGSRNPSGPSSSQSSSLSIGSKPGFETIFRRTLK